MPPGQLDAQLLGVGPDDGLGVAEGDGGGVGVAAVDDDLHRARPARRDPLAEVGRDHQGHQRLAAVDGAARWLR